MMLRRVVLGLVIALASFGAVGAAGVWALSGGLYGCTSEDEELGRTLMGLSVLREHPEGALPQGEPSKGCDEDDRFVTAWQTYRAAGSREAVEALYRTAAAADGWRPTASGQCYEKQVAGVTAYLSVGYTADWDEAAAPDEYGVEVIAGLGGTDWCE
ncbi:hypothetical protein NLX86_07770 [Streptomyces sp. A3M-1-3]|uniref:hypothetical protein n=1 Tax=Streptomyces sp. A3M-1-3 TaxID=2962044 RepID=UPI0020B7A5F3|nr:hypothetical protein [Streptomyces sp. A3M-1-3]MCP3818020.1 hypothetical protein [Streptomyces sp. A3M-1-3]